MREMMMAACAAGMMLAGPAQASTWAWFGGSANIGSFTTAPGFVGGTLYYYEFDTKLPLASIGLAGFYRATTFVGDDPTGSDFTTFLIGQTHTSDGVSGSFSYPTDNLTDSGGIRYDQFSFKLLGEPFASNLGWRLVISDDPHNLPSVPEPETWAMMIAGFGLVGSALRRRLHSRSGAA